MDIQQVAEIFDEAGTRAGAMLQAYVQFHGQPQSRGEFSIIIITFIAAAASASLSCLGGNIEEARRIYHLWGDSIIDAWAERMERDAN